MVVSWVWTHWHGGLVSRDGILFLSGRIQVIMVCVKGPAMYNPIQEA